MIKTGNQLNPSVLQGSRRVVIISLIFLSSCASQPPNLVRTPLPTTEQAATIAEASSCTTPALPSDANNKKDWKYGCFCGEDYPNYDSIADYYTIKPKDSIDEICRDHDVCYLVHGDRDFDCDSELRDRLDYIETRFYDQKSIKCSNVTSDIGLAFVSIFTGDEHKIARTWNTMLIALFYPIREFNVRAGGYPERTQQCNAPNTDEDPRT